MDEDTKAKLAAFSARFRAQRQHAEQTKIDAKLAKVGVSERKESNRKFHLVNVPLGKGSPLQRGEEDTRIEALRKQDDVNWEPLAVLVTGQWQVCRCCGHEAIATSGFYFREQHKVFKTAKRLRHINHIPDGFELEINIEGVVLQRCVKCLEGNLVDDLLSSMLHGGELQLSNQLQLFGE